MSILKDVAPGIFLMGSFPAGIFQYGGAPHRRRQSSERRPDLANARSFSFAAELPALYAGDTRDFDMIRRRMVVLAGLGAAAAAIMLVLGAQKRPARYEPGTPASVLGVSMG